MKIEKLNNNNFVSISDEQIFFQSYKSIIAIINKKNGVLVLGKDWDYSATTKRFLYNFLYNYKSYIKDEKQKNAFIEFEKQNNKTIFIDNLIKNKIIKIKKEG